MIPKVKEQRIKQSARIAEVLSADGVKLYRRGANLLALCPFHEDRSLGSFVVSERRNICRCFACDKTWTPVDYLMQRRGLDYPDTLRYLASMYGIWTEEDGTGAPRPIGDKSQVSGAKSQVSAGGDAHDKSVCTTCVPGHCPAPSPLPVNGAGEWQSAPVHQMVRPGDRTSMWQDDLPVVYFPSDMPDGFMHHYEQNPLICFLRDLPLSSAMQLRLTTMVYLYKVGTSVKGATAGWTLWWQIDEQGRVRTGKLMAYRADGHRDKARKYSFNWVHSMLEKAGRWSSERQRMEQCLFGLHLVDTYPTAEICLVESEKSALICSLFTDPHVRLWMATGGKSNLNGRVLEPLMKRERYIVLFPDIDGYEDWEKKVKQDPDLEDYPRLSISRTVQKHWTVRDGDKADMADIMLRMMQDPSEETTAEKAARRLGLQHVSEPLQQVIDTFDLSF